MLSVAYERSAMRLTYRNRMFYLKINDRLFSVTQYFTEFRVILSVDARDSD